MADERVMQQKAKETYDIMCRKLDAMDWKYEKVENELVVKSDVHGDDLPIEFIMINLPFA